MLSQVSVFRPLLSLLLLIPLHNALAEAPSNHVWSARWIGPTSLSPIDLSECAWIWSDEPGVNPTSNAPAGPRFFRRTLNLPADKTIKSATALFSADNHFQLTINDQRIGRGDDWQRPQGFDITAHLRPGTNTALIQADNDPVSGAINAAGLIGKIRVEWADGSVEQISTDTNWEANASAEAAEWKPVKVLGNAGIGPWNTLPISPASAPINLWTCYRKGFSLPKKPTTATTRIAVDSKYWLWVNGELVIREGAVKRGPNPQDTYFDVLDLAPHLTQGENQIAVLAWYWGKEGFSHKSSGKAGLLFEMDAEGTKVLSDAQWKIRRHPAFGDAGNTPNFRLAESSVRFDARLDIPDWTDARHDDASWQSASDFGAPPTAPWNQLWERSIPQWKDFGLNDYANAADLPKVSDGQPIKAKLPYNAQVTPALKVDAPAGLMVKMSTDNTANEIIAEYITKDGVQEFETPAWMSGHHVIYHIPQGVKILGLQYRESGFNTEFTSKFSCNDPFYEKLWTKSARTLYINMRDTFFDCPDRERAAWWGDIVIQLGQVFYTFDTPSHTLIRKCMYNLAGWQRPSKTFFSPIPAGNWDKELPQQMLASIGKYGFWTYYLNTGDAKTITDLYPNVKDYLSIWQTDGDGLIVHRSGENGWDWGDWGNNVDMRMLDNAWFCLALEGAANMADLAGKPDDAAAFRKQRESLIAAINTKFWNGSAYRDTGYGGATDDRANGLAVVAGIAAPDKYPAIKNVLSKEFHASPYMEKYILESFFLMNDAEAGLARMKKRYQEMVDSQITTLWELFTLEGTINHAWTGGPLTLLYQYVAGVSPTAPGFSSYQVKPQLGGLKNIHVAFDTIHGRIDTHIRREEKSFHLTLTSPQKTSATVCIPLAAHGLRAIRVGGQPLWLNEKANGQIPGITPLGERDGYTCFSVAPGTWEFEAR